MTLGKLLGKRTWIGLGTALALLLLGIMLGALLIVKGTLPPDMMTAWVCGCCGLAVLLGGCVAGKGSGEPLRPLMVALLLYGLLWGAALATSEPIDFAENGLWITGCVWGGGVLACVLCRGKKRKKRVKYPAKTTVKRRKHAVT